MENIVITGGLGYLGIELCLKYALKKKDSYKKIAIIGKTSIDDQKVKKKLQFILKSIDNSYIEIEYHSLDLINDWNDNIQNIISKADILYHLAAITDISRENTILDKKDPDLIIAKKLIQNVSKKCKFVFASTHIVYDGIQQNDIEITELTPVKPVLSYSKCKSCIENILIDSEINYVILRFATIYGYNISARYNTMPNKFCKQVAEKKIISIYSGGVQLKPLVHISDAGSVTYFSGETATISREIFHISESICSVKGFANMCVESIGLNPTMYIKNTDDSIPNQGYLFSNQKIKQYGFCFLVSLEEGIKKTIQKMYSKSS